MARPLLPLLIALMVGIVGGSRLTLSHLAVQVGLLASLVLLWIGYRRSWRRMLSATLLGAFAFLGLLSLHLTLLPPSGGLSLTTTLGPVKRTVEGIVTESSQTAPDRTELVLAQVLIKESDQYTPVAGRLLLQVRGNVAFESGDRIRFQAKLRAPRNFGNPGAFDYERSLRFRGIQARGFISDPAGIILIRRADRFPLQGRLEAFRDRIRAVVTREAQEPEGAIIRAMILGEQRQIPRDVMEQFNRTGTTHIIAISGFNVGIVVLFALFLARPLLGRSEWLLLRGDVTMLATWFAILVVVGYTFVAGAGLSVVRAALMICAAMVALLLSRERDLINLLALAALLILLVHPPALFAISFQLSFAAVAALLLWVQPLVGLLGPPPVPAKPPLSILRRIDGILRRMGRGIAVFVFVSLVATLGTLPLILYHFNRLSIVTLAANLVAVPLLGILATPVCLLIILAVPLSEVLAGFLIGVAIPLVKITLALIEALAAWSWSSLFVPTPTVPEIVAFYLLLIAGGWWLEGRSAAPENISGGPARRARLGMVLMVLVLLFFAVDAGWRSGQSQHQERLSLTAIDVGQGSAILVRFPGGHRMLVDGGGFYDEHFDVGRSVLAPFLWKEGIARIDTVVLTHPHPDHLQGLLFVIAQFGVREVWTNGDAMDSPIYLAFRELLLERRIPERVLDDRFPGVVINGVTVAILNPAPSAPTPVRLSRSKHLPVKARAAPSPFREDGASGGDLVNERSLVLRLRFGERAFLLTGDMTAAAEARLLAGKRDLQSDVLFVPHHGSLSSGEPRFLDRVHPRAAIVSCGADNLFGFPHPQVVRRLAERRIVLYRTDQDGAVTCSTDGVDLAIRTFAGQGH